MVGSLLGEVSLYTGIWYLNTFHCIRDSVKYLWCIVCWVQYITSNCKPINDKNIYRTVAWQTHTQPGQELDWNVYIKHQILWCRVLLGKHNHTRGQGIHFLWNLKVSFGVHTTPSLDPILSHINLTHNFTPCFLKIYSNITLPSMPRSPK
jgi:hypothetical protein